MSRYWAELDGNRVLRVVVCDDVSWLEQRLGGTWVETLKDDEAIAYCGQGFGYGPEWGQRFAPPWVQPLGADVEDASPYGLGAVVYHNGELWTSTVVANVWEPGVSGWRPNPSDPGKPPRWVQPTGAHDAYQVGEHVTHNGQVWVCVQGDGSGNNVWPPGEFGWEVVP